MNKNKYDFIQELLNNKRINPVHRERIFNIASKELETGQNLNDRVEKIEELLLKEERSLKTTKSNGGGESHRIKSASQRQSKNQKSKIDERSIKYKKTMSHNELPNYNNPNKLYNALLQFNQNPILKTVCHDVNEYYLNKIKELSGSDGYDFNMHLSLIKQEFKTLSTSSNKNISFTKNMFKLIQNYIHGKGEWSGENIKMSWSDHKLKEWTTEHPDWVPNPDNNLIEENGNDEYFLDDPFVSKLTGKTIETFTDLVLHFKSLWHIKDENSLLPILSKCNSDLKFDEWSEIKFENFSETINLYTDVDKLKQAYYKIIYWIKEFTPHKKTEIIVSFYEQDSKKILSIFQKDTFWRKTTQDTIEKPFGKEMIAVLDKQLNGLCDLILRAKFEDNKCAELNLWNGEKITEKTENIQDIDGVEYLLILKK